MDIRVTLTIESQYSRGELGIVTTIENGNTVTMMSQVIDITSYVIDAIVPAAPTPTGDQVADSTELHDWARAHLLAFILPGRFGEHFIKITASSDPALPGEMFEFRVIPEAIPMPAGPAR